MVFADFSLHLKSIGAVRMLTLEVSECITIGGACTYPAIWHVTNAHSSCRLMPIDRNG